MPDLSLLMNRETRSDTTGPRLNMAAEQTSKSGSGKLFDIRLKMAAQQNNHSTGREGNEEKHFALSLHL